MGWVGRRSAAIEAEVVTVSVVVAAAPEGVTVAGEKEHDAPDGSPEQLNDTAELKPFWGVTVMDVVPVWPAVTESDETDAAKEKSATKPVLLAG